MHNNNKHVNPQFKILRCLQGRANITQCNVTPKTTTTTTTTSTTTTTTPRPAPTKMTPPPRTERPTANETNLFRKINGNETPRQFTEVTDDDDLTFDELSEEDLPSVEAGTESTFHTNGKLVNEVVW